VTQTVQLVDKARKREVLSHRIGSENWRQVLVFTRTKHGASRLAEQLEKDGLTAAAIHGNKSQGARTKALADFKAGKVRVLVATDIAARGLDIDKLPHVVNFELPNIPEDYVHRIGRTARAGEEGEALSLVCSEEIGMLKDIERLLKTRLERVVMPGYEPSANPPREAPEPSRHARPGAPGQQRRSHGNSAQRPASRSQPRRANGY
jgi:ATP-dependent RNA helicase RhlE